MSAFSWRAWLAAFALVVLGVAIGIGGTVYFGVRKLRENIANPNANRVFAERALARIQKNLAQELDLTTEQATKLEATLAQSATNLKQIRQQSTRDAREEINRTIRQIAEELPQEKRAQFRQHVAKRLQWLRNQQRTEKEPD